MKVFYGVQGTGNGHITRARVMAEELRNQGIDVTFQFSGRPADKFFDMEVFGNYKIKQGLTFNIDNGQVNLLGTIRSANITQLLRDVDHLDLSSYDMVISDYEPITSWAAHQQNIPVIGIGHQYAFNYDIPKLGFNIVSSQIMKRFAPATIGIGLHWYHFNQPILPPIIDTRYTFTECLDNKIVVYLPFENQQNVINLLKPFTDFDFHVYANQTIDSGISHITYHSPSRQGFQDDLKNCSGVICNAGFELASEALELGKKLLVKPVQGQAEQMSNAIALVELGYGTSMDSLDPTILSKWIKQSGYLRITYGNVARSLAIGINKGYNMLDPTIIRDVWDNVEIIKH